MNRPQRERRDRLAEVRERIRGLSGEEPFAGPEEPRGAVKIVGERTRHRAEIEALLPARLACPRNGQPVERDRCLDCGQVEDRCSATRRYLAGEIVAPELATRAATPALAPDPAPDAGTETRQGPIALDAETLALLEARGSTGTRYPTVEAKAEAKRLGIHVGFYRREVRAAAARGDSKRFALARENLGLLLERRDALTATETPVSEPPPSTSLEDQPLDMLGEDAPPAENLDLWLSLSAGDNLRKGVAIMGCPGHSFQVKHLAAGEELCLSVGSRATPAAALRGRVRRYCVRIEIAPEEGSS